MWLKLYNSFFVRARVRVFVIPVHTTNISKIFRKFFHKKSRRHKTKEVTTTMDANSRQPQPLPQLNGQMMLKYTNVVKGKFYIHTCVHVHVCCKPFERKKKTISGSIENYFAIKIRLVINSFLEKNHFKNEQLIWRAFTAFTELCANIHEKIEYEKYLHIV